MIIGVETKIKVRFGLLNAPTSAEISRWVELTEVYIQDGVDPEKAGHRAAYDVFTGVDALAYFSEADTITALLALAKAK